ncbi:MAG: hypothetical protein JWM21_4417 [Acidobacteria bacterium]|nr:hypothetical protein [Acidobacteriota bacterium]
MVLLLALVAPCAACNRQSECTFMRVSSGAARAIPDGLGVNIHFTDPPAGEIKMLAEAGFRWVRMDLKWDLTEAAKEQYDFAAYDRLLGELKPFGIRALFILDYTNPLYDGGAPPRTEAGRQAFARWAVAAAEHFAGRGIIWETYNEPNHAQFWPPRPNPKDYVALALAVARAFREAVPAEQLIGPATSGIDFDFLEACFQGGLLEYWSAVSIHPYRRGDPETAALDYCRLRQMIENYAPRTAGPAKGKKQIPIISSEWGYSAGWRGFDEEKQGQLLARSWLTNTANNISLSIWYDWRNDGLDIGEPEHNFGTVAHAYHDGCEPVYEAKPAYLAARTLTTFFHGYRFEKRLEVGSEDDYVLVFRNANEFRVAAWTTENRVHKVVVPLKAGQYAGVRHTGESTGNVNSDQNGVVITLTTAPVYFRSRIDNK